MARAFLILLAALLIPSAMILSGQASCFDPKLPTVAFQCGDEGACPDGYECRSDGCCHVIGSPQDYHGPCAPAADAAVDAAPVDAAPADAAPADAAPADAAQVDAGSEDAAALDASPSLDASP